MNGLRRSIFEYLGIAVMGATVLILLMPFVRVSIVSNNLDRAEDLMRDGQCRLALARLHRIENWAALFPVHAHRLNCQAIRCQARICDFQAAQTRADNVFRRRCTVARSAANGWELFQGLPHALINRSLGGSDRAAMLSESSGYEVLAAELTRMGEHGRLSALSASLLNRDPHDPLGLRLGDFVASRNVPPPPSPPATSRLPPSPTLRPAPVVLSVPQTASPAAIPDPRIISPDTQWGVVIADAARTYDSDGVFRGTFDAGMLVQISEVRTTQAGSLAVCRPDRSGVLGALVLLPMSDLNVFPGSLAAAQDDLKSLRVQEARLQADIRKTRARMAAAAEQRNPAAVRYQEAKNAYLRFWEKARDLQARRDTAAGAEKVRCDDQLRQMRPAEIRLRTAYETAKKDYDAWKTQHPSDDPVQDPTLAALETRLQGLQRQIAAAEINR